MDRQLTESERRQVEMIEAEADQITGNTTVKLTESSGILSGIPESVIEATRADLAEKRKSKASTDSLYERGVLALDGKKPTNTVEVSESVYNNAVKAIGTSEEKKTSSESLYDRALKGIK